MLSPTIDSWARARRAASAARSGAIPQPDSPKRLLRLTVHYTATFFARRFWRPEPVYLLRPRNGDSWQGIFFLDGVKVVVETRTRDFVTASNAARSAEERIRRRGLPDLFSAAGTA